MVVAEDVARYAVRLSGATRPTQPDVPDFVKKYVKWGAGLRASQALMLGAKARALMLGRAFVTPDDIRTLAAPVFRHRVLINFQAEAEGLTSDDIVVEAARAPSRHLPAGSPDDARTRAGPVAVPVAGGGGRARHARTQGADHRRGPADRPASQPVQGGYSVEFAEYRQYMPGDEPSTVDWKVYARSDRHYVKKFEHDTNLDVQLLVDTSASMAYRSGTGMTKLQYAQCLTAALAYLLTGQRDAVGLGLYDDRLRDHVPSAVKAGQLTRLLIALDHAQPGSSSDTAVALKQVAGRLRRRGLIVVCSDLLDDQARVIDGLRLLRARGMEVVVFHVLDEAELTFPFEDAGTFRDIETGEEVLTHGSSARPAYLDAVGAWRDTYVTELRGAGIDYQLARTSAPLDLSLLGWLGARGRTL